MREMSKWNSLSDIDNGVVPAGVKINDKIFGAGPGHFGKELTGDDRIVGKLAYAVPTDACSEILNSDDVQGMFGITRRGQCTFAQKVRNLQNAGAKLAIILDNVPDSTNENTALFAMSGDGKDDIEIPAVFLFSKEGDYLIAALHKNPELTITVGDLNSLKKQYENNCEDDNCETVSTMLQAPSDMATDKESFNHLKKILNQLVSQFEVLLTNDDQTMHKSCTEDSVDVYLSKEKFVSDEVRIESGSMCRARGGVNEALEHDKRGPKPPEDIAGNF